MNLKDLKKDIIEDGVVDAAEVAQMKTILLEDGVIDREEADFLFDVNDAVSGNDNAPEWADFFVESIIAHVLDDPNSPGELDDEETAWLRSKLLADGQIDAVEQKLLAALSAKTDLPEDLATLL